MSVLKTVNASLTLIFTVVSLIMVPGAFAPFSALAISNTGFLSPTTVSVENNYNDWTDAASAFSSNDSYATETSEEQRQGWETFGFSIPSGSTINGIEVRAEAKSSDTSGCQLEAALSWNDGSFTSVKTTALTGSDVTYTLGGVAETWGRTWAVNDFSNDNFVVRLEFDDAGSSTCNNSTVSVDHVQVNVTYTPPVQPSTNPTLANSCGLDIALVLDSSGSIGSGELGQMKDAFEGFVSAFLPATPTLFSVTDFDHTGAVLQAFTDNVSLLNTAINTPVSGGQTNWEDGLLKAQSTFDPRNNHPNLVVFASDGNPTVRNGNTSSGFQQADLDAAVEVANDIKEAGTRIIALGIGDNLDADNLEAISSDDAVYTSDFSTLASTLADLASELCGGTITVKKLVDGVPAEGWTFDISGSPSDPDPVQTGSDGFTPSVEVEPGTYNVAETVEDGYTFVGAECTAGNTSWNTISGSSVTGITVGSNDIVSCVFNNQSNQEPVISITGDNPLELVVNVDSYDEQGATADDPEDGTGLPVTNINDSQVNTGSVGSYSVFYNFTDSDGASAPEAIRTVNVVAGENECNDTVDNDGDGLIDFPEDPGCESVSNPSENQPPVITVPTELIMLTLGGSFNPLDHASVSDAEDDPDPALIVGGDSVLTNQIGDYVVTYDATDSDGAGAAQKTLTVQVRAQCGDGIDNDDDGLIDGADLGCSGASDNDETDPVVPPPPPPPLPQCSDDSDNDEDGLVDAQDPGCSNPDDNNEGDEPVEEEEVPPTPPSPPSTPDNGGGLSMASTGPGRVQPQPQGEVLGELACEEYLKEYIKLGAKNNPVEVKKLQEFLNKNLGLNLQVTGFYDPATFSAVNQFQVKYGDQVLTPWMPYGHPNAQTPTGYVYKTTKRWINILSCPTLNLPVPPLP